jgi:hypothetical protein
MNNHTHNKKKGYVLLLAVLISSIILAMSMGVFAISLKEIALATFARDSVRAFAAASRGLECAMYYDRINQHAAIDLNDATKYASRSPIPYTPFHRGSSPDFVNNYVPGETWTPYPHTSLVTCATIAPADHTAAPANPGGSQFTQTHSGDSSLTYNFVSEKTCAIVQVVKRGALTTYTSNGFSEDCASTNPRRTQRTIEVSVNI